MLGGLSHDTTTFTLSMSIESEVEFHRVACTLATAYRLADDPGLKCAEVRRHFSTISLAAPVPSQLDKIETHALQPVVQHSTAHYGITWISVCTRCIMHATNQAFALCLDLILAGQ